MKRTALLAILLALTTSQADAFSSPGHQAIADVAQDRLSPATRAAFGRILQDSNDLASGALAAVATWPDDVRARAAHGTTPATGNGTSSTCRSGRRAIRPIPLRLAIPSAPSSDQTTSSTR